MNADYAIETRDLTKLYGDRAAVRNLSVRVRRGEVFGFLGPNGAGKTTTVKMLLGLLRPSAGDAALLGMPVGSFEARRKVGYLPELFRYQEWLSARELLAWHAAVLRMEHAARARSIDAALDAVGLLARRNDRIGGFSKGMQQRVGLAVALLGEPELLVLDEPTSALDPVGRAEVRDLLRHLKQRGTAVFLNSHLLTEVEAVCDSAAIVTDGAVRAAGPIEELLGPPAVRITFADRSEAQIEDVTMAQIPSIVASYVNRGAQIVSVVPVRHSLEERFLQIVKGTDEAREHASDRITHAS